MKVLLVYPEFPDMVGLLTALPDTQLWRRLKREGKLLSESTGDNTEGTLNYVPRMETARLVEGYKRSAHHLQPRRILPACFSTVCRV